MIVLVILALTQAACSTAFVSDCQPAAVLMEPAGLLPTVPDTMTERDLVGDDLAVRKAYVDLRGRHADLQNHVRTFCQGKGWF